MRKGLWEGEWERGCVKTKRVGGWLGNEHAGFPLRGWSMLQEDIRTTLLDQSRVESLRVGNWFSHIAEEREQTHDRFSFVFLLSK